MLKTDISDAYRAREAHRFQNAAPKRGSKHPWHLTCLNPVLTDFESDDHVKTHVEVQNA